MPFPRWYTTERAFIMMVFTGITATYTSVTANPYFTLFKARLL